MAAPTIGSDLRRRSASAISRARLVFERPPANATLAIIFAFLAFRLVLSLSVGLGVDESYSLANARDLSLSYFDHPPLHLWIAHMSEALFGAAPLARLPFVVMFAGTTWMMFRCTERLFGSAAGVWTALALNLTGFFTAAAGEWILPDGPMLLCLSGAAYCMASILRPSSDDKGTALRNWAMFGYWLGAAGLAKYQAIGFAVGLLLFFVTVPARLKLLWQPGPYLAFVLALGVISPVLIWNAENGWVSFLFQASRGAQGAVWKPQHLVTIVGGQILYLLPWLFVPLVWAGIDAARAGRADEARWLCLCTGVPLIVIVTVVPLFGPAGLPHWSMAGWLMLYPLLGDLLARKAKDHVWPRRWALASAVFLVGASTLLASQAATGWVKHLAPSLFAKGDPSLETLAWDDLRTVLAETGLLKRASFVAAVRWNEAGRIELALDHALPVLALTQDPRHFAFRYDPAAFVGRDALIVGSANAVAENIELLRPYFLHLTPGPIVQIKRGGRPEIELHVVYAERLLRPYPLPYPAR